MLLKIGTCSFLDSLQNKIQSEYSNEKIKSMPHLIFWAVV